VAKTLKDIAAMIKDIDFCMLQTVAPNGAIAARPMSNNGEVEYDGDAWFFSTDDSRMIGEIAANPNVGQSYQGSAGLLGVVGKPGAFVHIEAQAELIRDKAEFARHWNKSLDRWYPQGIDTPGMVLIKAHAARIHYWDGEDEGEVAL
jgi:general stress protein 26